MSYLKLDGSTVDSEKEAYMDFLKLNLYAASGVAFCHSEYGYTNLDVTDPLSVSAEIGRQLAGHDSHGIRLNRVVRESGNMMTAYFSGTDDVIRL